MKKLSALTQNHRNTLYHLEQHPSSHNIEWDDILSLLHEVGSVTEEHNGKVKVSVGLIRLTISRPRHKDVDEQLLRDIRSALREAGYFTAEK